MVGRKNKETSPSEGGGSKVRDAPPVALDGPMPPTYLGSAIIAILLCTPLGVIGLYWGLRVRNRWGRGDENGAFQASRNAEMFTYAAFGAFVIIAAIAIAVAIVRRITGDD